MKSAHETIGTNHSDTLPLSVIEPSPTNPRTVFDDERQAQLGETIRTHGVLQNLIVRPWPGREGVYECVDGHRRLLGAKAVGLAEVPVRIMELTTRQVIAIQLVTGESGEPLTALDEARGFRTALDTKDGDATCYTIESLAAEIKRHRTYIYQRLALLQLPAAVHELIRSGTLAPRTANLLARIPTTELRQKAIADIVKPRHRTEPLTYKDAEALIHDRYTVSLRAAPFDVAGETLGGPDGKPLACTRCPLKTGNDPERFADFADKNVCTSPACFRAKCNATWDYASAQAKAAGQRVLTDEEAAEVFEKHSPTVEIAFSSPYVDVNAQPTYRHLANEVEDKKLPTWRELIETAADKKGIKVPIVLARDRTGKQWQLAQLALCIEAARAIGEDMFRKTPVNESISSKDRFDRDSVRTAVRASDDFAAKKKAEADAAKLRMAECMVGLNALYGALRSQNVFTNGTWGLLLPIALHHAGNDGQALITKWLKLKLGGGDFEHSDAIEEWFRGAVPAKGSVYRDARDAHALIPLLLIAQSMRWSGLKCEGFTALAEGHNLDVKVLQKNAAALVKTKGAKEKPAAAPAPAVAAAAKAPAVNKRRAVITDEIRSEVRRLVESGRTGDEIAKLCGISLPSVQTIKKALGFVKERAEKRDAAAAAVAAVRGSMKKSTKAA